MGLSLAAGLASGTALAATVKATFPTAITVPVTAPSYTATGNSVKITLSFAPPTGTSLTVVNNTGRGFISGRFSNLAQGQKLRLRFGAIDYRYVADYYGGTGNDLVLHWQDQEAWAWGSNAHFQVSGFNLTSSTIKVPSQVRQDGLLADKTVLRVAAGANHSLALCSDGSLVGWGYNDNGELGMGTSDPTTVPVATQLTGVLAGKTVVAIAAGGDHCLALCSDGTLVAWGANGSGELGNAKTTDSKTPSSVTTTGALAGKSDPPQRNNRTDHIHHDWADDLFDPTTE